MTVVLINEHKNTIIAYVRFVQFTVHMVGHAPTANFRARCAPFPGLFPTGLFIEVRLFDDGAQDPWVEIVNAHPQV